MRLLLHCFSCLHELQVSSKRLGWPSARETHTAWASGDYSRSYGAPMICLFLAMAGAGAGCGSGVRNAAATATPPAHVFEVTAYGTKGDGTADDGPAIGRAIAAAIAAEGGEVVFPCGEFSLRSVVNATPGGRSLLYFKGVAAVTLKGLGHCSHIFTTMPQKSVLEFEDSTGISVTTLRITALNAAYVETYGMDGGSAVRFTGVTNGNISQVEVDGASAGALYLTKGTSDSSVSSNVIHDTYGSAIWEDDCGAASSKNCAPSVPPVNNTYEANTFTDTSLDMGSAIVLDDGNGRSNAIVKSNTISWTRAPIEGNFPGVHCIQVNNASNVSVLDNTCLGTPWDGIVVTTGKAGKSTGVTIRGNTIQKSGTAATGGSGIVVYDDPKGLGISGLTIAANSIMTASDDGIRLYAASKPGNIQSATIQNNTVELVDQRNPGSRYGIDIEYSADVTANANSITGNGKCIAVGVNVNSSPGTAPTDSSNVVIDILGTPLLIH